MITKEDVILAAVNAAHAVYEFDVTDHGRGIDDIGRFMDVRRDVAELVDRHSLVRIYNGVLRKACILPLTA